jgi:CRISPR/Cas system CMR-associated protein Cmr1 (group 7 of RAMP superfamily)
MSKEKKEEKAAKPARVVAKPTRKSFAGKHKRRTAMPMKERPKERRSSTVRGIIASITDQAKTNVAAVVDYNTSVGSLYENILNHAKEQKEAATAFNASVRELNASVREQMNENTEYVKNFYG